MIHMTYISAFPSALSLQLPLARAADPHRFHAGPFFGSLDRIQNDRFASERVLVRTRASPNPGRGAGVWGPLQALQVGLSAGASSLAVVTALVLRLYLGWDYVKRRLLSATVSRNQNPKP